MKPSLKSIAAENRHPVDRLFDIRERIKALQAEADILKTHIVETNNFTGDEYLAVLKETTQQRLDRFSLEKAFGKDAVAKCCKEVKANLLNLHPIAGHTIFD